jgi:hypothetical protein
VYLPLCRLCYQSAMRMSISKSMNVSVTPCRATRRRVWRGADSPWRRVSSLSACSQGLCFFSFVVSSFWEMEVSDAVSWRLGVIRDLQLRLASVCPCVTRYPAKLLCTAVKTQRNSFETFWNFPRRYNFVCPFSVIPCLSQASNFS